MENPSILECNGGLMMVKEELDSVRKKPRSPKPNFKEADFDAVQAVSSIQLSLRKRRFSKKKKR